MSNYMSPLEPTLSKIPELRKLSRHRSLTLAPPQKSFVCDFDFVRAGFFLLKGKQNFSVAFCSKRAGGGAGKAIAERVYLSLFSIALAVISKLQL